MTVITEDGGRQNMYAKEPRMYYEQKAVAVPYSTFGQLGEQANGRLAMLGFIAAVGAYMTTGQIIPGVL